MQPQLRSSQLLDASCCLLSEKMGEERGGREGVCTGQRCARNFSEASCLRCIASAPPFCVPFVGTTMGPTTSCRQPERLPSTRETRRVLSIRLRHTRGLSRTAMRAAPRCSSPPGPLAVYCCLHRNLALNVKTVNNTIFLENDAQHTVHLQPPANFLKNVQTAPNWK